MKAGRPSITRAHGCGGAGGVGGAGHEERDVLHDSSLEPKELLPYASSAHAATALSHRFLTLRSRKPQEHGGVRLICPEVGRSQRPDLPSPKRGRRRLSRSTNRSEQPKRPAHSAATRQLLDQTTTAALPNNTCHLTHRTCREARKKGSAGDRTPALATVSRATVADLLTLSGTRIVDRCPVVRTPRAVLGAGAHKRRDANLAPSGVRSKPQPGLQPEVAMPVAGDHSTRDGPDRRRALLAAVRRSLSAPGAPPPSGSASAARDAHRNGHDGSGRSASQKSVQESATRS